MSVLLSIATCFIDTIQQQQPIEGGGNNNNNNNNSDSQIDLEDPDGYKGVIKLN